MVTPTAGEVVLVPFPFSDLSQSKVRPAVCLADAGRGDWVLCQITSSPYGDPSATPLDTPDFASGGLLVASFARPGKLSGQTHFKTARNKGLQQATLEKWGFRHPGTFSNIPGDFRRFRHRIYGKTRLFVFGGEDQR